MNTTKIDKILNQTQSIPSLESALLGPGMWSYLWYRFRYFVLGSFLFYVIFFIKMIFLGSDYTSFYTTKILVLEQTVFWCAQVFWYFVILIQKEKNSLKLIKLKIDKKIALIYSFIVSGLVCYFLFKDGLLVFDRVTVYGVISMIFIAQIFLTIHLKYLHSQIYAHKRVYINVPLIIAGHFVFLFVQILLWNRYLFWSIPIVFGLQVLANGVIKFYYYKKEYLEKRVDENQNVGWAQIIKMIFSKKSILAIFMLAPEVFYFAMVRRDFLYTVNYSVVIFLLSALINSRLPGLLLQDFIKYNSDKYNEYIIQYMKRTILPLIAVITLLFVLSSAVNYLLTGHFDLVLIAFCAGMALLLSITGLLMNYFFSKESVIGLLLAASVTCIATYMGTHFYIEKRIFETVLIMAFAVGTLMFMLFNLRKVHFYLIKSIVYTNEAFRFSIQQNKLDFIFDINFDHINYHHPKVAGLFDKKLVDGSYILIVHAKRIILATSVDQLNPSLLFYCKSISKHTSINDVQLPLEKIDFKQELSGLTNSHNYNYKVLFNGLVKKHSGFRKKLI